MVRIRHRRDTGDAHSAKSQAYPQASNGDVNSAAVETSGFMPIPPKSDDHRAGGDGRTGADPGPPTYSVSNDASKAGSSRKKISDVTGAKVPSMVPPPKIPLTVPPKKVSNNIEKDATPSDTRRLLRSKKGSTVYKVSEAQLQLQGNIFRLFSPSSP